MKARWVRDPAPHIHLEARLRGAGEMWPRGCPMEVEHRGWSITRQIDDAYCFLGHPVPVTPASLHPRPSEKEHQQSAKTNTFSHLPLFISFPVLVPHEHRPYFPRGHRPFPSQITGRFPGDRAHL